MISISATWKSANACKTNSEQWLTCLRIELEAVIRIDVRGTLIFNNISKNCVMNHHNAIIHIYNHIVDLNL